MHDDNRRVLSGKTLENTGADAGAAIGSCGWMVVVFNRMNRDSVFGDDRRTRLELNPRHTAV